MEYEEVRGVGTWIKSYFFRIESKRCCLVGNLEYLSALSFSPHSTAFHSLPSIWKSYVRLPWPFCLHSSLHVNIMLHKRRIMMTPGLRAVSAGNNLILETCLLIVRASSKVQWFLIYSLLVFAIHPPQAQKCVKNLFCKCFVLPININREAVFWFTFKYISDLQSTQKYLSLKCYYTDSKNKEKAGSSYFKPLVVKWWMGTKMTTPWSSFFSLTVKLPPWKCNRNHGGRLPSTRVSIHRVLPARQCLPTQGKGDVDHAGKRGKKLTGVMPFFIATCYSSSGMI